MQTVSRLTGLVILLGLMKAPVGAQYDFEHPDCKIRYSRDKDNPSLMKALLQVLKRKNFKPELMIDNRAVIPGDTYYSFKKELDDRLYKSCTIHSYIRIARSRLPSKEDRVLYQKRITRKLPRITFKGDERCRKALQETFIHIPRCKPVGFAREK